MVCVRKSASALRSTPFFSARVCASARPSSTQPIRKLPASFTTLAAPGSSPKSNSPCPIAASSGRARALADASPDWTIHIFAAAAAGGRPNTGAATYWLPRCACQAASRAEVCGEMVDMDRCSPPAPSRSPKPSGPVVSASSTLSSASMVTTTPPGVATSRGSAAAPSACIEQRARLAGGPVVDGDLEARLHQVGGHGAAHQAKADEPDWLHSPPSAHSKTARTHQSSKGREGPRKGRPARAPAGNLGGRSKALQRTDRAGKSLAWPPVPATGKMVAPYRELLLPAHSASAAGA